MKRCVLNVSSGGWFPKGQDRLKDSILKFNSSIDTLFWRDCFPDGCPTHSDFPYAFKPYAIMEAMKKGYDTILWADASVWAISDISDVFSFIEENGYMFFENSYVGYFSSDRCLDYFGITREEAILMKEIMGCCFGLNLKNQKVLEFLDIFFKASTDGITFPGSWNNDNFQISKDPRVKGHRHDQTVASIIVNKLNMNNFIVPHQTFMCYKCQIPYHYKDCVLPASVCLLNEGM